MPNQMVIHFVLCTHTSDGVYFAKGFRDDDDPMRLTITNDPSRAMVFHAVSTACDEAYFSIEPSLPGYIWHDGWWPMPVAPADESQDHEHASSDIYPSAMSDPAHDGCAFDGQDDPQDNDGSLAHKPHEPLAQTDPLHLENPMIPDQPSQDIANTSWLQNRFILLVVSSGFPILFGIVGFPLLDAMEILMSGGPLGIVPEPYRPLIQFVLIATGLLNGYLWSNTTHEANRNRDKCRS
jgi:hypothetical protein